MRRGAMRVKQASHRSRFEPPQELTARRCAMCGKSGPDVDIRVCSCDKCGKPTDLCLEHARNH